MQSRLILACLGLFLASPALAQSTSSSDLQQPTANAQVQSDTEPAKGVHKNSAKDDDNSDHGRKLHVRLGTISVGAGYFSGPFFGPFWAYGFYPYSLAYAPFFYTSFYAPFSGPYYAGGFGYTPDRGEVKLRVNPKTAQVFVDGAYAGTVNRLNNIWLDSGAYNLSISAPGHEPYEQRIYVLSGKSLKINVQLAPEKNAKTQREEKR